MNNTRVGENGESKLVTFSLGREIYGIDIFKIREIIHFQEITSIPNAPEFVEGVIQVRNRILPVVDLKKLLGIKENAKTKRRIVILDLDEQLVGVIVDDISKVLTLDDSSYEALPEAVIGDNGAVCISRLAKTPEGLVIVLSPELILSQKEKERLKYLQEN